MATFDTYNLPDELYYQKEDHLWVKIEGDRVSIGLDDVAQASAQVITALRIKPPGRLIAVLRPFGTMEAGKYVGPLRLPVGGTVVEVNDEIMDNPGLLNSDPYGKGWIVLVEPDNLAADLASLAHGADLQPWLENSVADWRARGLLKK
jgi:glycine cleavage system H protein